MDYINNYLDLIKSVKKRDLIKNGFHQSHHIIPKCLGGSNKKSNLVVMTPREHILAHYLFYKIASKMPQDATGCPRLNFSRQKDKDIHKSLFDALLVMLKNPNHQFIPFVRILKRLFLIS